MDGDPELLDDSEFYQQLLKEFFEAVDPASSGKMRQAPLPFSFSSQHKLVMFQIIHLANLLWWWYCFDCMYPSWKSCKRNSYRSALSENVLLRCVRITIVLAFGRECIFIPLLPGKRTPKTNHFFIKTLQRRHSMHWRDCKQRNEKLLIAVHQRVVKYGNWLTDSIIQGYF